MKDYSEKLGFVIASSYRRRVLVKLLDDFKTPSQLCTELSLLSEQLSRTLKELSDKGLITCLNPQARKGRLYSLTPQGREIAIRIMKESGTRGREEV